MCSELSEQAILTNEMLEDMGAVFYKRPFNLLGLTDPVMIQQPYNLLQDAIRRDLERKIEASAIAADPASGA